MHGRSIAVVPRIPTKDTLRLGLDTHMEVTRDSRDASGVLLKHGHSRRIQSQGLAECNIHRRSKTVT